MLTASILYVKQPGYQTTTSVGTDTPSQNRCNAVIDPLNQAWWGIDLGQLYVVTVMVNATSFAPRPVSGIQA